MGVVESQKITLHSEPDFDCTYTEKYTDDGYTLTFVHLDVYYWSSSVFKKLCKLWPSILAKLPDIIYTQGITPDKKFVRFISHFGWKFLGPCMCTDGINRDIYFQIKQPQLRYSRTA